MTREPTRREWFDDPLIERGDSDPEPVSDRQDRQTGDLPVVLYDARERPMRRRIGFGGRLSHG